jgi:hypothetical protein
MPDAHEAPAVDPLDAIEREFTRRLSCFDDGQLWPGAGDSLLSFAVPVLLDVLRGQREQIAALGDEVERLRSELLG